MEHSINDWGHTPRDPSPRQPYDASSGDHPVLVPMQVPFPCQVTPNRKHRLAQVTNFVGAPLVSSIPYYTFQKQLKKQDQLLVTCHIPI